MSQANATSMLERHSTENKEGATRVLADLRDWTLKARSRALSYRYLRVILASDYSNILARKRATYWLLTVRYAPDTCL